MLTGMFLQGSSSVFLYSFSRRRVIRIIIFCNSLTLNYLYYCVCAFTEALMRSNACNNDRYVTKKQHVLICVEFKLSAI